MQDHSSLISNLSEVSEFSEFLSDCLRFSKTNNSSFIASIPITLKYIAPLAILQSIDLSKNTHFFSERTAEDSAILAYGSIRSSSFFGRNRFDLAKNYSEKIKKSIKVLKNNRNNKFDRPHFFTTFTFEEELNDKEGFKPSTIFLPRWHAFSDSGQYGVVFNLEINPSSVLEDLIIEFNHLLRYFYNFDYEGIKESPSQYLNENVSANLVEKVKLSEFENSVKTALTEIENKNYRKIVLAEKRVFENKANLIGVEILDRLKEKFSACYVFSFSDGSDKTFIGASPEILINVKNKVLITQAIAGSSSRGKKALEDAKLGSTLLSSDKNLREHNLVKESILRRLKKIGLKPIADENPRLLVLSNVQHLQTKIRAVISNSKDFLSIASELFPTPAVGGQPREKAVPRIRKLEGFDRGLYSGLLGWFSDRGEGTLIVGIRSAQFKKDYIELYAGAGIVSGSKPLVEQKEILLKQDAMLSILR